MQLACFQLSAVMNAHFSRLLWYENRHHGNVVTSVLHATLSHANATVPILANSPDCSYPPHPG